MLSLALLLIAADPCDAAADRYLQCVREVLGATPAEHAAQKRTDGVAECKRDQPTQSMYRECLPKPSCPAFLDCLTDYAQRSQPAITATSRQAQCAEHVRQGLRGVANSVMMLNEARNTASKRAAQSCILDDRKRVESCLNEHERSDLEGLAQQRQKDCEAWPEELAACILRQPNAKNCKPDEYPLWREPIHEGAIGPTVAWSIDVADEPIAEWATDQILIIADAGGQRAVRDGRVLWERREGRKHTWVTENYVVLAEEPGRARYTILDASTGKTAGSAALTGEVRFARASRDNKILVLTANGVISAISPRACFARQPGCVTRVAAIPEDFTPDSPEELDVLDVLADQSIIVGSSYTLQLFDPRGKRRFKMALRHTGADFVRSVPPSHVAVADSGGVALLSIARCAALGSELYLPSTVHLAPSVQTSRDRPADCPKCQLATAGCVAAYRVSLQSDYLLPAALPNGAVAFNDHRLVESTHLLGGDLGWKVTTGGFGATAGDDRYVYAISLGHDHQGPARLFALALADGRTMWQSDLPGAPAELDRFSDAHLSVGSRMIAARVGSRVFVLPLDRAREKSPERH